jgi:hypothetical protein
MFGCGSVLFLAPLDDSLTFCLHIVAYKLLSLFFSIQLRGSHTPFKLNSFMFGVYPVIKNIFKKALL